MALTNRRRWIAFVTSIVLVSAIANVSPGAAGEPPPGKDEPRAGTVAAERRPYEADFSNSPVAASASGSSTPTRDATSTFA